MKFKKIAALLLALLCAGALTACGNNLKELDTEIFDQDAVIAQAQTAVQHMVNKEFDDLNAMVREDLRDRLTVEAFSGAYDQMMSEVGAFDSYKEILTAQTEDKSTKEKFAGVNLKTVFSDGDIVFTVYMTTDLEITGFYMK